ncbi:MAG: MIP family channel protein [Candidatus Aenigmarchaeota archaeon]|nr:MIP family channel protein [Candidatus Aenigmarchaeota archaeon]
MTDIRPYLAEAIATFALVFIGAGAILAGNDLVGVALAHGLVLMAMIYAIAHVSGAHINPAVTISMLVTRNIGAAKAVLYIISQLIGAGVAGFFLKAIFTGAPASLNLGATALGSGVSFGTGILVEAILTFFLVFVIFGAAVDKRAPAGFYGLAIGLVLTLDILTGGPLTGAAMNPARAFGPALAAGFWANHLVYWIGPIVGGIVAALIYNGLLLEKQASFPAAAAKKGRK